MQRTDLLPLQTHKSTKLKPYIYIYIYRMYIYWSRYGESPFIWEMMCGTWISLRFSHFPSSLNLVFSTNQLPPCPPKTSGTQSDLKPQVPLNQSFHFEYDSWSQRWKKYYPSLSFQFNTNEMLYYSTELSLIHFKYSTQKEIPEVKCVFMTLIACEVCEFALDRPQCPFKDNIFWDWCPVHTCPVKSHLHPYAADWKQQIRDHRCESPAQKHSTDT